MVRGGLILLTRGGLLVELFLSGGYCGGEVHAMKRI